MAGSVANGLVLVVSLLVSGQAVAPAPDELEAHLASQRRQIEDLDRPMSYREAVALEMAATLDRAAQASPNAEARRARWAEATKVLDEFNQRVPSHPRKNEFAFQAAVYVWAQAESLIQQAELSPTDQASIQRPADLLDQAIARLRAVPTARAGGELLEQNRRFRLAQALYDRDGLESSRPAGAHDRLDEALGLLSAPFPETALQGYAQVLRAEILTRLNRFDDAQAALKAAAKADPPVPPESLLEAEVKLALARKDYTQALAVIERAKVRAEVKNLLSVETALAQRSELPDGSERTKAESLAFQCAEKLRTSTQPEARLALLALARTIREPSSDQKAEAWDVLAQGALALGETERASQLETQGASRAGAEGRHELEGSLREKAGAILFQAGRFAQAAALFQQVAENSGAGAARPRAGLLRILALARGLALGQAGCSREALLDALKFHLKEFPKDPTSTEARWILGNLRLSSGDRAEAVELWQQILHGHPRWLEARIALARVNQDDLETQLINGDQAAARERFAEAEKSLLSSRSATQESVERAELDLARARLELTPRVGHPDVARKLCDDLMKTATLGDQRQRVARLRIVAQAELGQFVDAERSAKAEIARVGAVELLDLTRLLDRAASATESDVYRRRFGQLMRLLIQPAVDAAGSLDAADRLEARLRLIRGQIFSGHQDEARRGLIQWPGNDGPIPDTLLDDLADTYLRVEAYGMAVDVFRLRAQHTRPGSLPWFEARYGQALSYYRAGKPEEARRLIDATAILHPDLGGGELHQKFEHLRQRLEHE